MSKLGAQLETFRDLPEEELRQQLASTRDELFRLQLGQYTNQVTSTALITGKRRDIARILTILRARELGTEKQAQKSATSEETSTTETGEAAPAQTKKKSTRKAKA
jgi:large subunit ribosomal protein L29